MPIVIKWWQALNPAIYLVSILPAIAVWILTDASFEKNIVLFAATLGVVLLQHAINLFNDAKDWRLGADREKYNSWVRVHDNNPDIANVHAVISLVFGSLIGFLSLYYSERLWILLYAIPFVILGLLYNYGQRPLSYTRAGEWVTGICYGPGVFGSLWFVAGQSFNGIAVVGMMAFAALSMSLLFSHQPPQIETDRSASKYSFAVRNGAKRTYQVAVLLFLLALFFLGIAILFQDKGTALILLFIFTAFIAAWRVINLQINPKQILINTSIVLVVPLTFSIFSV